MNLPFYYKKRLAFNTCIEPLFYLGSIIKVLLSNINRLITTVNF